MTSVKRPEVQANLGAFHLDTSGLWEFSDGIRWTDSQKQTLALHSKQLHEKFQQSVGFYQWPELITDKNLHEIAFLADQTRARTKQAAIFGIGGSHLGPEAILNALRTPENREAYPIQWLSNIDPASVNENTGFFPNWYCTVLSPAKSQYPLSAL